MPADCEMTIDERRKYLRRMEGRYRGADRAGRTVLLTEMEAVTGMHRKSLIRLLGEESLERCPRRKQRGRVYRAGLEDAVRVVWESLDYVCAERLTPCLLESARQLGRFGELRLDAELEGQLGRVSESTVARLLSRFAQDSPRLPRRGPQEANRLARSIPMGRIDWRTAEPGWFEVDLVHHSGESASGEYLHTLQMVDVATGWSERVAVLGRSGRAMEEGFRRILSRIPFKIVHLHPDNGPEFLNGHLVRFFGEEVVGRGLSRSRPYHKNDNRFVEQKNYSLVRAYLGYRRMDSPWQMDALNCLYEQMGLYYNLFQPVMHLVGKERGEQGRIKRRWDEARSPYQRLRESAVLDEERKKRLEELYGATNPRVLRAEIHPAIETLWDEPAVNEAQGRLEVERNAARLVAA
jgi:hypothetical protein